MNRYTIEQIRYDLRACSGTGADGWRTVLEASDRPPDYKWTPLEALDAGVSVPDVAWYCHRIGHPVGRRFPLACAIFALPIFESEHPGDMRVRTFIETTERFLRGKATAEELREARLAGVRAAGAAWPVARPAGAAGTAVWAAGAAVGSAAAATWAAARAIDAGVPELTLRNHLRAMLTGEADLPPMPRDRRRTMLKFDPTYIPEGEVLDKAKQRTADWRNACSLNSASAAPRDFHPYHSMVRLMAQLPDFEIAQPDPDEAIREAADKEYVRQWPEMGRFSKDEWRVRVAWWAIFHLLKHQSETNDENTSISTNQHGRKYATEQR